LICFSSEFARTDWGSQAAMNDVDEITRLVRGNACCLVAAIGFALNYLPVKKYDTGDGIFFCAAMSVGILGVGLLQGMFLTSLLAHRFLELTIPNIPNNPKSQNGPKPRDFGIP